MAWLNKSHDGYTVIAETVKTVQSRPTYTSEFSIPPNTDFIVICNYGATDLSASTHVEMYYSDVHGGTFTARTKTSGYYFNSTSCAIDAATKTILQDVSTVKQYPRYKMKIPSGGGNVKFVIMYAPGVTW